MKFSDMPYERPDLEDLKRQLAELTHQLAGAPTFEAADEAFRGHDSLKCHVDTLSMLASIRNSIDTRDEFYAGEVAFWNAAQPELDMAEDAFVAALLASPFRAQFASAYGPFLFEKLEQRRRIIAPQVIDDLKRENELATAYQDLIASAEIPFEGQTLTLAQIATAKSDADDARRLAAWKAEGTWLEQHAPALDSLYDQLVQLRTSMAHKLGYQDFVGLGYDVRGRLSYDRDDVRRFRDAARTYVTPVLERLYRTQAERTGCAYPLSYADFALSFRSGNPAPSGSPEDLLCAADGVYRELSPETDACFSALRENGLLDVVPRKGKAAGGFMEALPEYHVPFIFANCNGTRRDVDTVTHEVGHAFEYFLNARRVPQDLAQATSEACEVHSMSMEFLAWPWTRRFVGDDERKYKYAHLTGALELIVRGSMADEFQEEMHAHPELTASERNACWKRLLGAYEPWMAVDGAIPFYGEGRAWQQQIHFYLWPFYYVDYALAQAVALEIWAESLDDFDVAWQRYLAFTREGGTKAFADLVSDAGLTSPFDESCLKGIAKRAGAWLEGCDLSGIA